MTAGSAPNPEPNVVEVGRLLASLGHVSAFGHVSRRTSATSYQITAAGDLGELGDDEVVTVPMAPEDAGLPDGAPPEAWLHSAIYRARPDVAAVVRAQPRAAFAVAAVTDRLPVLHGQGAWLGGPVPVHPVPRLVRSESLGAAAARTLGAAGALLLRGNGAVAVGGDLAVAATRMHLLADACDVWLRATAAAAAPAGPLELADEDADAWAAAGTPLLPRLWRHLQRTAGTSR